MLSSHNFRFNSVIFPTFHRVDQTQERFSYTSHCYKWSSLFLQKRAVEFHVVSLSAHSQLWLLILFCPPPHAVSLGLITVSFINRKMLMIDPVCSQIDSKMAALGKRSLIGQSKHMRSHLNADITLTLNTLSSSPFRPPYLFYFPTLRCCFLFLSLWIDGPISL